MRPGFVRMGWHDRDESHPNVCLTMGDGARDRDRSKQEMSVANEQQTVPLTLFTDGLSAVLRECFETVSSPSMFLDPGDAFFQTLATVSAEEASQPAATGISNLAAEVNHTAFYIDVTLRFLRGEQPGKVDWDGSWQVGAVDEAQWSALQDTLRTTYDALQTAVAQPASWAHREAIAGGIGMVAHCAYHLGEVRRTLGVIRG